MKNGNKASWYKLATIYGGLGLAVIDPIAGIVAGVAFYNLYKNSKAKEDTQKVANELKRREQFRANFRARQNYDSYQDYLQSHEWRKKRSLVVSRSNGMCEEPACNRALEEVHHKWYPRIWGRESIESLVALCKEHHRKAHRKEQRTTPT